MEIPYESLKLFFEQGKYRITFYIFEGYPLKEIGNGSLYIELFENYKRKKNKKV